jgi:type IV pilus assembly protein PilQ
MKKSLEKHHYKIAIIIFISLFIIGKNLFCQGLNSGMPPNYDKIIPALNFKDTDARDIFRSIAYEYKTNIVIENTINNKISVALFNLPVMDALKIIAGDNGFVFGYDSMRFSIKSKIVDTPKAAPVQLPVISYEKGKLNVSATDVDIQTFISTLRDATKKNFLLTNGTTGKLTGVLNNINLRTGLNNLLINNGFYLVEKDSIYYISRSQYFSGTNTLTEKVRGSYWVGAHDNLVTIDVNQASADQVINDIANQLNLQIVKLSVPDAKVTIKCSEVSVETAFNYIFDGSKFSYRKDEKAYIIGDKDSKSLQNTKLVKLVYLRADKIKETIPASLIKDVTVGVSIEHNAIILTGSNECIDNIKDYIHSIDLPVPQVTIEALVIDYNLTNAMQLGISAGKTDSTVTGSHSGTYFPGINATASGTRINTFLNGLGNINILGQNINFAKLGNLPSNFYLTLQAQEQNGIANVKSRPILSTLNGHTASLKIGTIQNYVFTDLMPITSVTSSSYMQKQSLQQIEASISFEITPWVGPNSELTLEIKPNFQTPASSFTADINNIPAINTRAMVSTVRLRDGETIVLGGLIQDTENNTVSKTPYLGDIPLIGLLFTSTNKTKIKSELMIYITPHISYGDDLGNVYYDYSNMQ